MSGSSQQQLSNIFADWANNSSSNKNTTNQFAQSSAEQSNQNLANQRAFDRMQWQAGNVFDKSNSLAQNNVLSNAMTQNQIASDANLNNKLASQGGVYRDMGLAGNLRNSLQQSLANPSATSSIYGQIMGGNGNNYADAMKDQYVKDATRAQENMLSNLDARAAASGMSGGSRHGVATAQGMNDINANLQRNMAETGYNTFDKDLMNKLNIAAQADQGTLARQQMMQQMLGQQQGVVTGARDAAGNLQNLSMGQFNAYNAPWQGMQQYVNAVKPTILSNTKAKSAVTGKTVSKSTAASTGKGTSTQKSKGKGSSGGLLG